MTTVPVRWSMELALRALVPHRLALGPDTRHHRAHLAYTHAVGDLDFDLLVIDDLGNLAHQPSRSNYGVAAAQVLDQVLVLAHPLLLWPDEQEVHHHQDRHHRDQHR